MPSAKRSFTGHHTLLPAMRAPPTQLIPKVPTYTFLKWTFGRGSVVRPLPSPFLTPPLTLPRPRSGRSGPRCCYTPPSRPRSCTRRAACRSRTSCSP
ncbi:hypothetical protein B0H10DRAFT_2052678 [Mycena sp. CBHHK59/15]|nr:hypothetical protein B0H10DRAFT_2052678 [Mycena sp. CBHHK59/15]